MSNNLIPEIDKLLEVDVITRHSYFQMKYFILGKEPTTQSQMWQCLREIKARRESIKAMELELEETKDNIELLDLKIEKIADTTDPELKIKKRKLERKKKAYSESIIQLNRRMKNILEETDFFYRAFLDLRKKEELKPFDDLEAQKDYWNTKLSEKFSLKMLLQGPLDIELADTILALPDDMPIKQSLMKQFQSVQNQMVEYKKKMEQERLKG